MSLSQCRVHASRILVALFFLAAAAVPAARAQQSTTGTVTVTVLDQSGAVVSGATLELHDLATGTVRTGVTQDSGAYSFVGLNVGTYSLTVTKEGFAKQVFDSVIVHSTQVTDIKAALKVGVATETVEVHETAAPLVETTTNSISTNIDLKEVEDLPLGGRDVAGMTTLVPGTSNVAGVGPTWNGLPVMAQGSNVDGVIGSTNRMKFSGNGAAPDIQPRIEDISEMTVQTDHLDANQGNGQSSMEVNYVTRRGQNAFHGRAFEDFQNSYLNANSWTNNANGDPRPHFELNDFGGSVGGRIIRDKLFFFGTYAENKEPGSSVFSNAVLTSLAQQGVYTENGTTASGTRVTGTICLFTYNCPGGGKGIVDQYNAANGTTFPTATSSAPANTYIAAEQANITSAALPLGKLGTAQNNDPNWQNFTWESPNPTTYYFPTVRVDYDMSSSMHFDVSWNMTKESVPSANAATFPGKPFDGQGTGSTFKYYTAALGFDWIIKPTLINQFRGGFLYHFDGFGTVGFNNPENNYSAVAWNYPGLPYPDGGNMSGQQYSLPTPDYYPVFNFSDSITWQHGQHSLSFGGQWYREQDHYWNAPAGFANFGLGIASGDPAANMFTPGNLGLDPSDSYDLSRVKQLYAILAGRISSLGGEVPVNLKTQQYASTCCSAFNLDELSYASGLFVQDSWRLKPNFTLNYGLAWNFTTPQHDLTGAYHSVDINSMYGPSGIGNLFNPGVFRGTDYPVYTANGSPYRGWYKTPQPSIGIAWNPQFNEGFLGKLSGGGNTVIRAGFAIKDSIEPYQYFWDYATDQDAFYYDHFNVYPTGSATPGQGFFTAGSMAMACSAACGSAGSQPVAVAPSLTGGTYLYTPFPTYQTVLPMSATTFTGFPAWGITPNIKQPYTQSWNLGIQRQIGSSNAIEIRYIGNRVVHQWLGMNINEVNVFAAKGSDPTFLAQFQQAQKNLSINAANGKPGTFANFGFSGEAATPIFDAAFAGEPMVNGALADYSDSSTLIPELQTGQVGSMATVLDNPFGNYGLDNADYYCNLVGAAFGPCSSTTAGGQGYTGAGAGYPINYFQANPYNAGNGNYLLSNGGYSTYNALQIDFRQKSWHGMQFDINYTWAHNLGLQTHNDWEGTIDNGYTLRDLHLSYAPTQYDLRHVVNASGTYDLPFGTGKRFLNYSGMVDRIVGGWTIGTIFTFHTGNPFSLYGGYGTFNDYADGGVTLNGVTRSQIASAVGVYKAPNTGTGAGYLPTVSLINPTLLSGWVSGGNLSANTVPGTIAAPEYFYGPHFINDDLSITKAIPIRENLRFSLQGEFLNAFNHPNFGNYGGYAMDTGVQDGSGFGTVYGTVNGARAIELRANLEF
jgi:hypothetical protein